mgnify:CR=1 FL=1|jgi:hypothetical protein
MFYPYANKEYIEKGTRIAIEGAVIEKKENGNLLVGFYPDTKANILEINGNQIYQIKKKEFLHSARKDIHPEILTKEFEELLVELREVIDEDFCFENNIEYNLGAICGSPIEILDLAIRFVKKVQEKEKE